MNHFCTLAEQHKETNTPPYQMAKKDNNGAACCKEDMVIEEKETESDKAQTEDEDVDTRMVHTVQETAF